MLKIGSKRRRTTNEVKIEREQSKMKAVDLQAKLAELRNMDAQLAQQKKELDNGRAATNILNGLVETGQIKQRKDGTWSVPGAEKK